MGRLVSPAIVGREAELADLGEALTAARGGNGRVVIISGEAGIGKSRLTREVAERAREARMKVLVGRAAHTGTPVPYRPFAEAMQSSLRKAAEIQEPSLDPYRRALRRLLGEVEDGALSEDDVSPLMLMEGLLRLLAVTARETGVLLVLEDLHWADADTLWKSAKWLRGLELRASDQPGFWERYGYHNDAGYRQEQRYGF